MLRIAAAKQKISKKLLDAALPLATAQAVFLMEDEEVGADEEFVFPSNGEEAGSVGSRKVPVEEVEEDEEVEIQEMHEDDDEDEQSLSSSDGASESDDEQKPRAPPAKVKPRAPPAKVKASASVKAKPRRVPTAKAKAARAEVYHKL